MTTPEAVVKELNERFAVLAGAGKVRVMRFADDGTFTLESMFDFHQWFADRTIPIADAKGAPKPIPISDVWRTHPKRRKYEGIVFDPRAKPTRASDFDHREHSQAFNVWRGFSVEAEESKLHRRFIKHLLFNVCGGDAAQLFWLVGWMAHLIQRPWEKPGVAVVLKGAKGVGKTIVGDILRELLKHHTVTVSQPRHLVGNFNQHLASAVLVLVEEAFWAGDKTAEGALKDQITGATIRVEPKGFDVKEMPSFHRYLITGNADWIVPATHDERRYAVFDVGDAHQDDKSYFGAMMTAMDLGGYAALMHHLRTFDLSAVDPTTAPKTKGLVQQKIANLRNVHRWWFETLCDGEFPEWADADGDWSAGDVSIPKSQLRTIYERWHGARRWQDEIVRPDEFGRELRAMCPSAEPEQRRVKGQWRDRVHFYDLPALAQCRGEFARWLRSPEPIEWGE